MAKTNILVFTKTSWRRLEDVFWRPKAKANIFVLIKTSSEDKDERRLQDVFIKTNVCWDVSLYKQDVSRSFKTLWHSTDKNLETWETWLEWYLQLKTRQYFIFNTKSFWKNLNNFMNTLNTLNYWEINYYVTSARLTPGNPINTTRGFHVETTWKRSFPRRFNVESTWCVCRQHALFRLSQQ